MELYRSETYKQLQVLNLLDVVIVSRQKNKNYEQKKKDFAKKKKLSYSILYTNENLSSQESGEGTEFLKRLQESERLNQQHEVYCMICMTNTFDQE